jgi:PPOX class probable F420-dependent enzyme
MSVAAPVTIPESHRDLLEGPVFVTLVTMMPDGSPQATPVWVDYDGEYVIINTARGRQKDRNMKRNPKVAIVAIDPKNGYRWMEIRGEVAEFTEEGAVDVINKLSKKYNGRDKYYSGANASMEGKETRVTYKIRPTKVIARG